MPTRYAVLLKTQPAVPMRLVRSGRCAAGHDLTVPGATSYQGHAYRCVPCWEAVRGPELCAKGLHARTPGQRNCPQCTKGEEPRAKDVSYLFVGLPPMDVLDGAVCDPSVAHLFDPVSQEDGKGAPKRSGHLPVDALAAMSLCERCPVRTACLADALEWRREGVWGGAYFTARWHQAASSARLQGAKPPELRTRQWAADRTRYRPRSQVTIESQSTVA